MGRPKQSNAEIIAAYLDAVMRKDASVIDCFFAADVEYMVNGTSSPDPTGVLPLISAHCQTALPWLGVHRGTEADGKRRIKPSKKNVKTFLDDVRATIKAALASSAADLIKELNPKIRGWANYHGTSRINPRSHVWIPKSCLVFGDGHDGGTQGRPHARANRNILHRMVLEPGPSSVKCGMTMDSHVRFGFYAPTVRPIKRHVKVRVDANPYDPAHETYFEEREEAHMRESFRGTRILRFLWYEQSGLCPVCNIKITRTTGWRLHYCVSRTMGGSTSAENCLLLHPECHDRVHRLRLSVSKPRLLPRGVRSA